jgi:thiaminase
MLPVDTWIAASTTSCQKSMRSSRDFFSRAVALELSFFEAAYTT